MSGLEFVVCSNGFRRKSPETTKPELPWFEVEGLWFVVCGVQFRVLRGFVV